MRLFGSVLRDDFGPESDVDVLLEFGPGVDPDLFELGGIQQDLTDLFQREVDLKVPAMFSAANLERVLASSVVSYAAYATASWAGGSSTSRAHAGARSGSDCRVCNGR
ncbi:MAG: nucleotidyltransferase domain-containing protein [Pyrinomonadaceae bacterium]|nr:nucleotidyltransferase domain-containing protein [Phycisphaerales bacterium]